MNPSAVVIALSITLLAFVATIAPPRAQTEPQAGQPRQGAKPSVPDLEEQVVYQRAFEAVIWSQPTIGIYGFRRALRELGMQDNEIVAMSKPSTTRHELLTANRRDIED